MQVLIMFEQRSSFGDSFCPALDRVKGTTWIVTTAGFSVSMDLSSTTSRHVKCADFDFILSALAGTSFDEVRRFRM